MLEDEKKIVLERMMKSASASKVEEEPTPPSIKTLQKTIVDYVQAMFRTTSIQFFLGGSRRFGYENPTSDYDFFVYSDLTNLMGGGGGSIGGLLISMGFKAINKSDQFQTDIASSHAQDYPNVDLYAYHDLIHVGVFSDEKQFSDLAQQHDLLEKFLKKTPTMCLFISTLKYNSSFYTGGAIYRALVSVGKLMGWPGA
jgi:hypothetical protein